MQSLYVTEQGARVTKEGPKIKVMLEDVALESVRADRLTNCVVLGNVSLTTPAVRSLLANGVDVVFLRVGGGFVGRLSSGLSKNVLLRRRQYQLLENKNASLSLAIRCVTGKIDNQRRLLRRYQKRRKDDLIAKALVALRHSLFKVETVSDMDQLRGVEGHAAASYFSCWPVLVKANGIEFKKRLRRPPPDPVNVLLSFGYTQLGNFIHSAVEAAGFDPYMGALHSVKYGRPSLVLDLIEEFRPAVVDTAVLRAINNKTIVPADFDRLRDEDAEVEDAWEREEYSDKKSESDSKVPRRTLIFKKTGIKKWISAYERRMDERAYYPPRDVSMPMREIIRAQIYRLAKEFEGGEMYESYLSPI